MYRPDSAARMRLACVLQPSGATKFVAGDTLDFAQGASVRRCPGRYIRVSPFASFESTLGAFKEASKLTLSASVGRSHQKA